MAIFDEIQCAVRALARSPTFSLPVVLTLAVGIGANTAVFSVVNSVLLRPLPYENPERLMAITYPGTDPMQLRTTVPSPAFLAWTAQSRTFEAFAEYTAGASLTLLTREMEQIELAGAWISPNLFSVLGVRPTALGRTFQPDEGRQACWRCFSLLPLLLQSY